MNSCRLCLGDFLVLGQHRQQEHESTIINMKQQLQTVFTFEITPHKGLSNSICPDCAETVSKYSNFACAVFENQQQLYQQIDDEFMLLETPPPEPEVEVKREPPKLKYSSSTETPEKEDTEKPKKAAIRFERNLISRYLDMVCDLCHEDQYTYPKLETHFKKHHGRLHAYVVCCGEKLSSEESISAHLKKHMSTVKSPNTSAGSSSSTWDRRVANAFGTMLTDFKKDLEGYEPLPNMALALKGDSEEQKKMYDVQDYLVQTYFTLDCELCGVKISNLDERRMHFRAGHPSEKYFVSCCRQRFSPRISIMRHLNRHWKRVVNDPAYAKRAKTKTDVETSAEAAAKKRFRTIYAPLMNEFRDDLVQGGFRVPTKVPEIRNAERNKRLHQMQDFLIAKHAPLNCELCGAEISTYAGRQNHFRIGHSKEKFYIQCCGKKLTTRHGVIVHLLRHRKGLPVGENYPGRMATELEKHEQDDASIEAFFKMDCELCDYTGGSYLGLRLHFQKHHREEGFFITCCNRRFKTKYHIIEHINSHRKSDALKCEHCEATFFSERIRRIHVSRKHVAVDSKIFQCEHCVESFSTKKLLMLHAYKHQLVACEICGIEMKRCSLRVHKLDVHKTGEEIVCHLCAKVYHSKHVFNKHYREAHLGIRRRHKRRTTQRLRKRSAPDSAEGASSAEWQQVEEEKFE